MSKFLIDRYSSLVPYVPGEQPQDRKYIKLNTNESPYPPSPKAVEAIDEDAVRGLRLYSDPECRVVSEAIAEYYGVKRSEVIVGNGSDELLSFAQALASRCPALTAVTFQDIRRLDGSYIRCCFFFCCFLGGRQ